MSSDSNERPTFKFPCPNCNARLQARESQVGKTKNCPTCQTEFTVPAPPTAQPTVPPEPLLPPVNYFYLDKQGNRQGPYSLQQLQQFVDHRIVTEKTLIEKTEGLVRFPISLAKEVIGLTFPPPQKAKSMEWLTARLSEVLFGLSAAKDAAQAQLKLNGLNVGLISAYRSLGDAAEQAGWGGELCDSVRKQRNDVVTATALHGRAASDAELARNTPGAGAAKQVLSSAKAQMVLTVGVLDGLRERLGRTLMDSLAAPHIGTEHRTEVMRLTTEIANCNRIIERGKTSLVSKPMLATAGVLLAGLVVVGVIVSLSGGCGENGPAPPPPPRGHPLKNSKPGDWARYELTELENGRITKDSHVTKLLVEVISNDGKKVKLQTTAQVLIRSHSTIRPDTTHELVDEEEIDLLAPPESAATSIREIKKLLQESGEMSGEIEIKAETGKTTRETVRVAGKALDCTVTPTNMTIITPDGESMTMIYREWTSNSSEDVPPIAAWKVKTEMTATVIGKKETGTSSTIQTLAGFGSGR